MSEYSFRSTSKIEITSTYEQHFEMLARDQKKEITPAVQSQIRIAARVMEDAERTDEFLMGVESMFLNTIETL